ncbi:hypothetical protein L0669_02580 [Flavobacterium bizetiae]|uniref:hypothetical protein n=1 Tax=Flavobacterium bizetiae TaxID=2704140 RepID=UPI0021E9688B|nr:hypothetical protein [Flavobacterium bizetiae]UTN04791.1 hypothetical protein L0669_02580 [Flavobacterium bizetiae]
MKDCELSNIDIEEIECFLEEIEKSFKVHFLNNELIHITKFGQLCDYITNKIELENCNNCTNQQAFYKLREAIAIILNVEKRTITLNQSLADLFPRKTRITDIKKLETYLGFKLNILRPHHCLSIIFSALFTISFVALFFILPIGLLGILISITGFKISHENGTELSLKTIRQIVEKMTRENYLESRRNQNTFNKNEIENVLIDWFSNQFDLDKTKLTREAKLF